MHSHLSYNGADKAQEGILTKEIKQLPNIFCSMTRRPWAIAREGQMMRVERVLGEWAEDM